MRIVPLTSIAFLFAAATSWADDAATTTKQDQPKSNVAPAKNDRQNQTNDRQNEQNRNDQTGDPRFASQKKNEGQWKGHDHHFATCVAFANQIEVAMARIASQKSKNAEIKRFAEMMIQEHE